MLLLNKIKILLNSNCWRTNYLRLVKNPTGISSLNYSTTNPLRKKVAEPYKFMGSKAEKLTMDESFYHLENKTTHRRIEVAICWVSVAALLIYFGILREENEYDEIIKGKHDKNPDHITHELHLTMQYDYCKKNHMKCDDVITRLNEIRKAKGRPLLD